MLNDIGNDSKKCKCDYGNITIVKTGNLMNGNTQSCGCLKSKGELKITQLLINMKIPFKTQYKAENIINQALTLPNAVLFVKNKNGETFQIKPDCELNYIQWQTI